MKGNLRAGQWQEATRGLKDPGAVPLPYQTEQVKPYFIYA